MQITPDSSEMCDSRHFCPVNVQKALPVVDVQQCCGSVLVLEEVIKRMGLPGDPWADPGNWKLLTPSLVLEMYFLSTIPIVGAIFKDITLRELAVAEKHLDCICDWSQLNLCVTFKIGWVGSETSGFVATR